MSRSGIMMAALGLLGAGAMQARAQPSPPPGADYRLVGTVQLGAPGWWDYLTYEAGARRLYVSHFDRIDVVDVSAAALLGSIGPLRNAHGIAIVPRLAKGYATSGDDGLLDVIGLADLRILKRIKLSPDCDGVIFDPGSGRVLAVSGDARSLTVIDPTRDAVERVITLPGKPEFLAVDGHGKVFVNLADMASIARVDIGRGRIEAVWPLAGCSRPGALAYDARSARLFSGCANRRLIVVDAAGGRNLASLPIGPFSDGIAVDGRRHLVFCANGDGTLTVVHEDAGGRYSVVRTIPTFFGGRNIAIDPATGTLFIAYGRMKIESPLSDPLKLRFGWDGLDVAMLRPEAVP